MDCFCLEEDLGKLTKYTKMTAQQRIKMICETYRKEMADSESSGGSLRRKAKEIKDQDVLNMNPELKNI
jgi:hypothetical protein